MHSRRFFISTFIVIVIMAVWFFQVPPFNMIALKFNDLNFELNSKSPHPDVVFVEIGEKSINQFGRWPWDRRVLADALELLSPARVVLLDMVFSETTNRESDTLLSQRFVELDNLVCSYFFRSQSTQLEDEAVRWLIADSALERLDVQNFSMLSAKFLEANIEEIQSSCLASGAISIELDDDSLVRRYPLAFSYQDLMLPSLGVQGLRFGLSSDLMMHRGTILPYARLAEQLIPIEEGLVARLNFYDLDRYQRISFDDLVSGRFENAGLEDKIVILGISEAGVSDLRSTPLGSVPGALVHYTFIANVLDDLLLYKSKYLDACLIILLSLIPILVLYRFNRVRTRVILYLATLVLLIIINKLLYFYAQLLIGTVYPVLGFLLMSLYHEFCLYRLNEDKSHYLAEAFKSYVSPDLLKQVLKDRTHLTLGGEERYVTLLFSDIRSFSSISETMSSTKLVQMLNAHFEPLTRAIIANGGMLDKYIGDAIMAIFNAPIEINNHPKAACRSAIEMVLALQEDNETPFRIGVGINSGLAVVGNMGSSLRFNYTAIGDTVNTASRLEGLCKDYKVTIILSEETKNHLDESFVCRCLGSANVKGKRNEVVIYELMLPLPHRDALKRDFDAAFSYYSEGVYEEAARGFQYCIDEYGDQASEVFLTRCLGVVD